MTQPESRCRPPDMQQASLLSAWGDGQRFAATCDAPVDVQNDQPRADEREAQERRFSARHPQLRRDVGLAAPMRLHPRWPCGSGQPADEGGAVQ